MFLQRAMPKEQRLYESIQHKASGVERETPKGSDESRSPSDLAANKRAGEGNSLLSSRRRDTSLFKAVRIESVVRDEGAHKKLNFKTCKLTKRGGEAVSAS